MILQELETSQNILDRQEYARQVKEFFIPQVEENIKKLKQELSEINSKTKPESIPPEEWDIYIKNSKELREDALREENEFLKNLKTKLSNYDVYQQKIKCQNCQEVECICYELGRSNTEMQPEVQPSSGDEQPEASRTMATSQGTTGDIDSDFEERVSKLF